MKLLLSKFGTPKGGTIVSHGISCLPARFMAEPREKPFGEVLRMQPWVFIGRTDAEAESPVLWPCHWKCWLIGKDSCWEGLESGGEGEDRGWDGWMASLTQWTWVWVDSGSWWWTGRPGVLWFMGLQIVGHDWATELNWTNIDWINIEMIIFWYWVKIKSIIKFYKCS